MHYFYAKLSMVTCYTLCKIRVKLVVVFIPLYCNNDVNVAQLVCTALLMIF